MVPIYAGQKVKEGFNMIPGLRTVTPECQYSDHQGWMAHILHQRIEVAFHIAILEINELKQRERDYEGGQLKNHQLVKTNQHA